MKDAQCSSSRSYLYIAVSYILTAAVILLVRSEVLDQENPLNLKDTNCFSLFFPRRPFETYL